MYMIQAAIYNEVVDDDGCNSAFLLHRDVALKWKELLFISILIAHTPIFQPRAAATAAW